MKSHRRSFIGRLIAVGAAAFGASKGGSDVLAQQGAVRGFDHVALPMQNVDAMITFYRALGFQVTEGAQICVARFGSQMINFHRPVLWQSTTFTLRAAAAKPPCGDMCFVWEGTPDSLNATLKKAGASVVTGPVNRQGGRGVTGSSVYVRDPDENLLEFIIYS